jgi:hypothetical protein
MSQHDSSCKCRDHAMATKELKEKLVEKEILVGDGVDVEMN